MAQHEYGTLPEHLTYSELKEIAESADTLVEVQQQARVSRKRAKEIINTNGLSDEIDSLSTSICGGTISMKELAADAREGGD